VIIPTVAAYCCALRRHHLHCDLPPNWRYQSANRASHRPSFSHLTHFKKSAKTRKHQKAATPSPRSIYLLTQCLQVSFQHKLGRCWDVWSGLSWGCFRSANAFVSKASKTPGRPNQWGLGRDALVFGPVTRPGQAVFIDNPGWKAVGIWPATAQNFPQTLRPSSVYHFCARKFVQYAAVELFWVFRHRFQSSNSASITTALLSHFIPRFRLIMF